MSRHTHSLDFSRGDTHARTPKRMRACMDSNAHTHARNHARTQTFTQTRTYAYARSHITHTNTRKHTHTPMLWPRRAALRRREMIYGEKQSCCTGTSASMRHYMSRMRSRYSGFSPQKSYPDRVIAKSGPLSQYLLTHWQNTHEHTNTHTHTHTRACTQKKDSLPFMMCMQFMLHNFTR